MVYNEYPTKKKTADPLPYIIVFAILFLVALGVLTWVLGVYFKSTACGFNPNIWCSNNWSCNNVCPGGSNPINPAGLPVNACFGVTAFVGPTGAGATGLANCIFGPTAAGAFVCVNAPTGGPPTGGTQLACDCPAGMSGSSVQNCFNGCASNLGAVPQLQQCCCNDPNNPACAAQTGCTGGGCGIIPVGICIPPSGGSSTAIYEGVTIATNQVRRSRRPP